MREKGGLWVVDGRIAEDRKAQSDQKGPKEPIDLDRGCQEFADTTRTTTREPPVLLSVRQIGRDRQDVGR